MMVGMRLGRFVAVMLGVQVVRMREMSVMAGRFMIGALGVLGGFAMMMRGALMMLRGELVMFGGAFSVSHVRLLVCARVLRTDFNSAIVRQDRDAQAGAPRLKA